MWTRSTRRWSIRRSMLAMWSSRRLTSTATGRPSRRPGSWSSRARWRPRPTCVRLHASRTMSSSLSAGASRARPRCARRCARLPATMCGCATTRRRRLWRRSGRCCATVSGASRTSWRRSTGGWRRTGATSRRCRRRCARPSLATSSGRCGTTLTGCAVAARSRPTWTCTTGCGRTRLCCARRTFRRCSTAWASRSSRSSRGCRLRRPIRRKWRRLRFSLRRSA